MSWDHLSMQGMNCLWRMTWQVGVLVVVILALRLVFGSKLSSRWRCYLWWIIFVRLMMPVLPGSPLSLFNLLPADAPPLPAPVENATFPVMHISTVDSPPALQNAPLVQAAPQAKLRAPFNWSEFIFAFWLAGMAALAARLLIVNIRFARLIARDAQPAPGNVAELWRACAREMGVAHPPMITVSAAVTSPALAGLFRPRLLLPPAVLEKLSFDSLYFVFMHESAHVRRRDLLVSWLACVLAIIHWFNPAVWAAMIYWREDSEAACDQAVLAVVGNDRRIEYGTTLLNLAARLILAAPRPAMNILNGKRQLKQRLRMIARFEPPRARSSWLAVVILATVACAGLTDVHRHAATTLPTTKPTAAGEMVTQVYDMRDLMIGGASQVDVTLADQSRGFWSSKPSEWAALIRQSITPEVWNQGATLEEFKDQLIVSAPLRTHAALAKFLAEVRSGRAFQVCVRVRLLMTSWDIDRLKREGIPILSSDVADARQPLICPQKDIDELMRAATKEQATLSISSPRLTMLNHQGAYMDTSTYFPYIAGYIPGIGAGKERKPDIRNARDGIGVAMKADISDDGQSVLISLRVNETQFFGFESVAEGDADIHIDTPVQRVAQAATEIAIPRDRSAAFAVMISDIDRTKLKSATTRPSERLIASKSLLVLVTPEIIQNRTK